MSMGRSSPEYRTVVALTNDLRLSVRSDLLSLGGQLLSYGLISPDSEERLRNAMHTEAQRAATCVDLITSKVEEDPRNYHTFIRVLQVDPYQYQFIVSKLQQTYTRYVQAVQHPGVSPTASACASSHLYQRTVSAPAAVKYFSATMTIDDFVSFLSKEGVPPKDCQIILDNGIGPKVFITDIAEEDITGPELGFSFAGKKVLKRLLKSLSPGQLQAIDEAAQKLPTDAEMNRVIDSQHNGVLKHIGKIADEMENWNNVLLMSELGLRQADINQIQHRHPGNSKLQAREALQHWKQRNGSKATYNNLMIIFMNAKLMEEAHLVERLAASS